MVASSLKESPIQLSPLYIKSTFAISHPLQQMQIDYYELLGLSKTASHLEVKQAYRKLALKHHPDKNEDKQKAKEIFTQITDAYAVLNDPQKRENYDKYGVREHQFAQFQEFQQFMGDFGLFEEFIDEFLSFDDLGSMQKMFAGMATGGRKKGGSRRKRGSAGPSMTQMNKMYEQMLKQTLKSFEMDFDDLKENQDEEEEDEEELTQQQLLLIEFGKKNCEKKKTGKKRRLVCKFCSQKFEEDEVLIHFSEKHMKQFELSRSGKEESKEPVKVETK